MAKVMFQARIEKPVWKEEQHLILQLMFPDDEIKKQINNLFLEDKPITAILARSK